MLPTSSQTGQLTSLFAASISQRSGTAAGVQGASSQSRTGTQKQTGTAKKDFLQAFEQAAEDNDKAPVSKPKRDRILSAPVPTADPLKEAFFQEGNTQNLAPLNEKEDLSVPDELLVAMLPQQQPAQQITQPLEQPVQELPLPGSDSLPLNSVNPLPLNELPGDMLPDELFPSADAANLEATQQDVGIIEGFDLLSKEPVKQDIRAAVPEVPRPLDNINMEDPKMDPIQEVLTEQLQITVNTETASEATQSDDSDLGQGADKPEAQQLKQDIAQAPTFNPAAINPFVSPEAQATGAPAPMQPQETQASLTQQIVQAVQIETAQDSCTFNLQLKPEALGKVQIELILTKEGLSAQIKASDAAAKGLIVAELDTLQQALKDKGIQVVQMEVLYDQTMQDMAHFSFSQNRRDAQGSPVYATVTAQNSDADSIEASIEALTASSMYETASVEYSA